MIHTWWQVDYLYPLADLRSKAKELADEIAGNGPLAVEATKRAVNMSMNMGTIMRTIRRIHTDIRMGTGIITHPTATLHTLSDHAP